MEIGKLYRLKEKWGRFSELSYFACVDGKATTHKLARVNPDDVFLLLSTSQKEDVYWDHSEKQNMRPKDDRMMFAERPVTRLLFGEKIVVLLHVNDDQFVKIFEEIGK